MNCTEYEMMISKLLDGELVSDESPEVFAHIAGCGSCREFYHSMQMLSTSLDRIEERLPNTKEDQFRHVDLSLMRSQPLWNRQVQMRIPIFVTLILVVVISLGFSIYLTTRFSKNETIYVTNLPVVTITADSRTMNSIK